MYRVIYTQKGYCSQNAVTSNQECCPYVENVITSSVLTKRSYCA